MILNGMMLIDTNLFGGRRYGINKYLSLFFGNETFKHGKV